MRMIFKKIATLALATIICLSSLTSCHGSLYVPEPILPDEGGETDVQKEPVSYPVPDGFDESKNYEISFWAKNDTNTTQVNIYKKAIADFEALYPNVKVKLKLYTDYGRIYNDVITNIATNTTPNVCITYPDHIATYMTGKDTVVPLNSLMDHKDYGLGGEKVKFDSPAKEEIVPKFLEECLIDGTYYALPYMRSTEACYVNKTYVEALGYTLPETLTWDFIWEVSEAATKKNEDGTFAINGQDVMIPFIYKSTDNMMIQMLRQLNAGYSTDNGSIGIFNDTTRDLLLNIAENAKTRAFCTFSIIGYPANFLNAGQCIFAVDSTAGATWMGAQAPNVDIPEENMIDFETVVMTIPQYDPDEPKMISQGPSMCIFNKKDSGEVLASWLFMQFLLTNDVQIAYASTEGYVPVTSKAQESAEYIDYLSRSGEDNEHHYSIKMDATKLLIDNVDNTFVTPVFNGSASLRNAAGQMIEEVTKGARRKKVVDDAFIDKLYNDMVSLYHLDLTVVDPGGDADNDSTATPPEPQPLPAESVTLLVTLGVIWMAIIAFFVVGKLKKIKK